MRDGCGAAAREAQHLQQALRRAHTPRRCTAPAPHRAAPAPVHEAQGAPAVGGTRSGRRHAAAARRAALCAGHVRMGRGGARQWLYHSDRRDVSRVRPPSVRASWGPWAMVGIGSGGCGAAAAARAAAAKAAHAARCGDPRVLRLARRRPGPPLHTRALGVLAPVEQTQALTPGCVQRLRRWCAPQLGGMGTGHVSRAAPQPPVHPPLPAPASCPALPSCLTPSQPRPHLLTNTAAPHGRRRRGVGAVPAAALAGTEDGAAALLVRASGNP